MTAILKAALAISLAGFGAAAQADEVWSSDIGDIIYEADTGDQAILSFPIANGGRLMAYFPGLAGNFDNRSVHWGFWIGPPQGDCDAELAGIDGTVSDSWGEVVLAFDGPAYPTSFTALFGLCTEDLDSSLRGYAQ